MFFKVAALRLLQINRIEKVGWNRLANDAQAVAGVHNITLHGRSAEGQASLVGGRRVLVEASHRPQHHHQQETTIRQL